MTHTPGPWFFDKHANAIIRAKVRPDFIAQFCEYVGPPEPADLSLMVLAPDILKTLEAIVNSDMAMREEDEGRKSDVLEAARTLIKAIRS